MENKEHHQLAVGDWTVEALSYICATNEWRRWRGVLQGVVVTLECIN